jgi:hypothetical protein
MFLGRKRVEYSSLIVYPGLSGYASPRKSGEFSGNREGEGIKVINFKIPIEYNSP